MAIDFETKVIVESDWGFAAEGTAQVYTPFSGTNWNTTASSDTTIRIQRISHADGVSSVTLADPINLGHMDYVDVYHYFGQQTLPESLFDVKVGEDPETGATYWIRVRLTDVVYQETYMNFNIKYYEVFRSPNGMEVVSLMATRGSQIYSTMGSEVYRHLGFGVNFIVIPGRVDPSAEFLLDNMVMTITQFGYIDASSTSFTLTPDALTYYNFPQMNQEFGTYKHIDVALDLYRMADRYGMTFSGEAYSPEVGPESGPDGYGQGEGGGPSFDDSSDTIDIPDAPEIGVSNVGFVNVYKTGSQSLQDMGVELFPPLAYTPPVPVGGTDTTSAIVNGFNAIVTFLQNIPSFFDQITANTYINYIIDCHVLPVTPTASSTPSNIKVGSKTLTAEGYKVTSDYKDVDCGTISLSEYYQNFADFLTSFKLYLPFIGFVPAKPEWFYRESLNVVYRFNVIDGSFVAFVRSTGAYVNNNNSGKTIVGQYGGNACIHLPITGATYASMVSGLIGAGAGMVAGAASGNIASVATSAIAAATQHGEIAQSNAYSSSVAFLGCRRPFALIERPVSNYSASYQKERGIPSNISKKLSGVKGFAVIGNVHLDGIAATDAEKAEIERLLHEGVIL